VIRGIDYSLYQRGKSMGEVRRVMKGIKETLFKGGVG